MVEAAGLRCPAGLVEEAAAALAWPEPQGEEDWPWLLSWLHAPKRKGRYVVIPEADPRGLAARLGGVLR